MENKSDVVLIDANVLLRYLLHDDDRLYLEAINTIDNNTCIVLNSILQEVIYVLSGPTYNIPRNEIKNSIFSSFKDIYYIDKMIIEKALDLFTEKPKLDFPDCLLLAYNSLFDIPVITFDKKLNSRLEKQH